MATDIIINPVDTNIVYIANGGMGSLGHGIYRSENGGTTFGKMDLVSGGGPSNFLGKVILDISKSDPDILIASIGNSDGSLNAPEQNKTWLMRTENGGDTWTVESTEDYSRVQGWYAHTAKMHPQNPDIIWAAGQPFTVYKTTNGGGNLAPVDPINPNHIYVGNEIGVYQSKDGGENWTNISGNLPDAVLAMELGFSNSNRTLRLATHGNGAYQLALTSAVSNQEEDEVPGAFKLDQNYPNPFNPSTTIKYSLKESGTVSLEVFDITGKKVAKFVNKAQIAGEYAVAFDGSNLSSGTYIYKLKIAALPKKWCL